MSTIIDPLQKDKDIFSKKINKDLIIKDYSKNKLLTDFAKSTLEDRYLLSGETPQDAFARAASAFADSIEHAQRLYEYVSNGWFMFATPLLSNGGTERGLPISCFLGNVPDSRQGLLDHYNENAWLSSMGGGIGGYWGNIRSNGTATSKGSATSGSIPFLKIVDSEMLAFNQGKTRRGSYAAYQEISHPEIEEFLDIRRPTGGDINRKCLNLHQGVVISDDFMNIIDACTKNPNASDEWHLIDPHTKNIIKTVSAKELWIKILTNRSETGEPYIMFKDTVNNSMPWFQKELGLKIQHSNLCTEITLATDNDRTAVCCLSSVNLETFDEWKDNYLFIEDLIRMLDNVLSYFIDNAPQQMKKAVYSAYRERSIGLGAMGFHSYLQKKNIPFDAATSKGINKKIFSTIFSYAKKASLKLAEERGPCPDYVEAVEKNTDANLFTDSAKMLPVRNSHLIAIAPNASSSIILGTSPSIEPFRANAYTHKTLSGSHLVKNIYLEKLLTSYNKNTPEIWSTIITNGGSVQHLDFLTEYEKAVFKTAQEINQAWIVQHASDRQEYICQAQSINLFFSSDINKKELHNIHMQAWKNKVKTLYYLRSKAVRRADNVSEKVEQASINIVLDDSKDSTCLGCEG